jgi:hypothetical protein
MKFLLAAALILSATSAQAATYTTQMSCAKAKALVDTHGAIVLYSSPYIYDRYVAHQGYCSNAGDQTTRPAYVPTRDTAQCWVGYYCAQDNRGGGGN